VISGLCLISICKLKFYGSAYKLVLTLSLDACIALLNLDIYYNPN